MVIRGGSVAALMLVWLASGLAHAQAAPQRVKLRYSAPAECPDDLGLVHAVEGFLGQSLRDAREQTLAIDVRAQGDKVGGYSAKLSFVGAQGKVERFIDHPDCDKLIEAAALMLAISIDPERVKARRHVEADAAAGPPAATEPEAAAPPSALPSQPPQAQPAGRDRGPRFASAARESSSTIRTSIALMGLTGSGTLPRIAPAVGAELALRWGPLEAGVGGRYWVSRSATVPDVPASSIDVSLISAGLRVCGVPTFGHWSLPLCARGDLGDMAGSGQHVNDARSRHDLFGALGGSLTLSYTRRRLVPLAGLELHWAVSRPRFGVLREGRELQAFRPDAWGFGGFVGLAYRL